MLIFFSIIAHCLFNKSSKTQNNLVLNAYKICKLCMKPILEWQNLFQHLQRRILNFVKSQKQIAKRHFRRKNSFSFQYAEKQKQKQKGHSYRRDVWKNCWQISKREKKEKKNWILYLSDLFSVLYSVKWKCHKRQAEKFAQKSPKNCPTNKL